MNNIKRKINLKKMLIATLIVILFLILGRNLYKIILHALYPNTYSEYVYKYSEKYNIESDWVFALIKAESNFKAESISQSGAVGLMQLMEKTAVEVADGIGMEDIDLKNPEKNIEIRN